MNKLVYVFCLLWMLICNAVYANPDFKDQYMRAKNAISIIEAKWNPIITAKQHEYLQSLSALELATKISVANPTISNHDLVEKRTQETEHKQAALDQTMKAKNNEIAPWKKMQTDLLNQEAN